MTIQQITISVDIPEGLEATGEFREPRNKEHFINAHGDMEIALHDFSYPRIILRRKPEPKPLQHDEIERLSDILGNRDAEIAKLDRMTKELQQQLLDSDRDHYELLKQLRAANERIVELEY